MAENKNIEKTMKKELKTKASRAQDDIEKDGKESPGEDGESRTGLLKIKVKAQGIKALEEEKKEIKLREKEELLNKVDKVALSVEKRKEEKTFEEHCEEFKKEIEELSPLEDEVVEKSSKKKRIMEGQDDKRKEKKEKKAQQEEESQEGKRKTYS
ncbi:protein MNN4-like [Cucumis melo var. makuwa]|uniref:Protein MNN4-like n=1 Tax=Cucumis melo var. makuwa TaxID=1194695 RepID=A0A5D3BSI2_CUCMM|nr:protein MNN4-like [Cucumis melo var. makuwa]